MKLLSKLSLLLLFPFFVEAATVRLLNDTLFPLTAVIYAADGTELGQTIVKPGETSSWSDGEYSEGEPSNHFGGESLDEQDPTFSQTPYTVTWTCPEGTQYSVCQQVATGATVTAQSCEGAHYCKPKKKPEGSSTGDSNE